jgi:long-subunit fatty acid transport protein
MSFKKCLIMLPAICFGVTTSAFALGLNSPRSLTEGGAADVSVGAMRDNPAAIGFLSENSLEADVLFQISSYQYQRSGIDPNTGEKYKAANSASNDFFPFLGFATPFGTRNFRLGITLDSPYFYKVNFGEQSAARYQAINFALQSYEAKIAMALNFSNTLSVGIGGSIAMGSFDTAFNSDVAGFLSDVTLLSVNGPQTVAQYANSRSGLQLQEMIGAPFYLAQENPLLQQRVEIEDCYGTAIGFNAGVQWQPSRDVIFGLSYISQTNYNLEGFANYRYNNFLDAAAGGVVPENINSSIESLNENRGTPITLGTAHNAIALLDGTTPPSLPVQPGGRYEGTALVSYSLPQSIHFETRIKPMPQAEFGLAYSFYDYSVHDKIQIETEIDQVPSLDKSFSRLRGFKDAFTLKILALWQAYETIRFGGALAYESSAVPKHMSTPTAMVHSAAKLQLATNWQVAEGFAVKLDLGGIVPVDYSVGQSAFAHWEKESTGRQSSSATGNYRYSSYHMGLGLYYRF